MVSPTDKPKGDDNIFGAIDEFINDLKDFRRRQERRDKELAELLEVASKAQQVAYRELQDARRALMGDEGDGDA